MTEKEPIIIAVDEDILDLIPIYMGNRWKDVEVAEIALAEGDFETLEGIGHMLKGSGGGYGMDWISEVGEELEEASKGSDIIKAKECVEGLKDYLERVQAVPE